MLCGPKQIFSNDADLRKVKSALGSHTERETYPGWFDTWALRIVFRLFASVCCFKIQLRIRELLNSIPSTAQEKWTPWMRSRAERRTASSCPVCGQTAPRAPFWQMGRQTAPKDPLGMCPAGNCSPISRDTIEKVIFLVGLVRKLQRASHFYQLVN